jgi:2-dehydropantoate 2-reductase
MALSYAIIGTGGIGGYYGGRLAHIGCDVHFLFHSDYEFVKQHGLQVDSVNGNILLPTPQAYHRTQDMPKCDVIFVSMKTVNNHLLKDMLMPILHEHSVVVLVQNGLGMEENLSHEIPHASIVGATAFICTTKVGPGLVHHAEYGTLTIAPYNECDINVLQQVVADFEKAGVSVNLGDDLLSIRWKKLVWNIPYNGLTVVLNAATNELTFNKDSRQIIIDLMTEVVEAGRCCGAKISDTFISKMIGMTEKMTPYSPSMRLDYEAKRPMEIGTMYSNPIAIAKAHGYRMSKTEILEKQLRFIAATKY